MFSFMAAKAFGLFLLNRGFKKLQINKYRTVKSDECKSQKREINWPENYIGGCGFN